MRERLPPTDDPLARAEAVLRDLPIPDGPTEPAIARALAALRAATGPGQEPFSKRRRLMFTLLKVAAVLAMAAAGLHHFGGSPPAGAAIEFAEVAATIREAKAFAFRLSVAVPGREKPSVSRQIFDGTGRIRAESLDPDGPITIHDLKSGRGLSLNPAEKTAIVLTTHPGYGFTKFDILGEFRALVEKQGEPIGKKVIDGIEAQGFRIHEKGREPPPGVEKTEQAGNQGFRGHGTGLVATTVWADPESKRPLRVEMDVPSGEKSSKVVMSDFDLDPEIDPALFRLEPPEGYKIEKVRTELGKPEEEIARLLRSYAEASGGSFPPRFDDWAAYGRKSREKARADGVEPTMQEVIQLAQAAAVAGVFTSTLEHGYGYRPEGVKLGDADKILFWYRPNGSETYRALFGDLHADDLPPTACRIAESHAGGWSGWVDGEKKRPRSDGPALLPPPTTLHPPPGSSNCVLNFSLSLLAIRLPTNPRDAGARRRPRAPNELHNG